VSPPELTGGRRVDAAQPATSAELEADAAAELKAREDAVVKSEAESAAKLVQREEAVKAREAAVTGAEKTAAANTITEGIWTIGKDIVPGTYRTAKALTSSCYWSITRTGSNGGDIIENDGPKGGFPMVVLSEGQTFENNGCGDWKKQWPFLEPGSSKASLRAASSHRTSHQEGPWSCAWQGASFPI
jgi:hypothetical protein